MHGWAEFAVWKDHHEELIREAERVRLVRQVRDGRRSREGSGVEVMDRIEVRWGLEEDEEKIADLLQLNGIPRWVAFEERYMVAERDGKMVAALRYRTEPKRLLLGLMISDPWAEERPLAVALYAGAGKLAREMGVEEVITRPSVRAEYAREAGYRRRGRREWRLDVARVREVRKESVASRWRRLFGVPAVPFFGAFSGKK